MKEGSRSLKIQFMDTVKTKYGNVEQGQVYFWYQCGHIIRGKDDPRKVARKTKKNKLYGFRCCPECGARAKGQAKLCHCGAFWFGKQNLKSGKHCINCREKSKNPPEYLTKRITKNRNKLREESIKHYDCKFRSACLSKAVKSQVDYVLPCSGCTSYEQEPISFSGDIVSLWSSVLQRAIKDIKTQNGRDVANWKRSKSCSMGSFLWICEILGIPPKEAQSIF
jgi:hypothetical protein